MSETKHTPGPWHAKRHEVIHSDSGFTVAEIFDGIRWIPALDDWQQTIDVDVSHANARLIAAAPELLEALEGALLCLVENCSGHEEEEVKAKAEAAIRKARGE